MTPKLVARNWNLTSVVRNPDQKNDILEAGKNGPGKVDVLIESIEDVKSEADAKRILDLVKPDWVVWSAGLWSFICRKPLLIDTSSGAGGKGGADRTNAIDRDAAVHFIRGAIATPSISKFLLVSALSVRRGRASWFDDESYALMQKINNEIMPAYYKAKLAADETLTVLGEERVKKDGKDKFSYIILRPGALTDDRETGLVELGKTPAKGQVTRGDVADVAARLLETAGACGWFDMLGGKEPVADAISRVIKEGINSMEGEDVSVMKSSM